MTKDEALFSFFNSFGIPGYPSTAVPTYEDLVADGVIQAGESQYPYLTYTPVFDAWGGYPISLTINLWYLTSDEAPPSAKAQEISNAIGPGGITLPCDGGYIWLNRGSPWCQSLTDNINTNIKRRYINVTADFLTLN